MVHLERLFILKVGRIAKRVEGGDSALGHTQVLHAASKPLTDLKRMSLNDCFKKLQNKFIVTGISCLLMPRLRLSSFKLSRLK